MADHVTIFGRTPGEWLDTLPGYLRLDPNLSYNDMLVLAEQRATPSALVPPVPVPAPAVTPARKRAVFDDVPRRFNFED